MFLWFLSGIVASKMMIEHIGHKDRMPSFLKMSEHFLISVKQGADAERRVAGGRSFFHMLQVAILTPNTLFAEAQFECKPIDGQKTSQPYC